MFFQRSIDEVVCSRTSPRAALIRSVGGASTPWIQPVEMLQTQKRRCELDWIRLRGRYGVTSKPVKFSGRTSRVVLNTQTRTDFEILTA